MYRKIAIIIGIVFIVSVFGMFFLHDRVRMYRRLYRLGYSFVALLGMAASVMLVFDAHDNSMDPTEKTIFITFVMIVGIPVLLFNIIFLILGEGNIITSTLVNCNVSRITGGKFRQRVSYRVDGTSLEGNRDSFLLRYKTDRDVITAEPVTENTSIVVEYYDRSFSIVRVTRKD